MNIRLYNITFHQEGQAIFLEKYHNFPTIYCRNYKKAVDIAMFPLFFHHAVYRFFVPFNVFLHRLLSSVVKTSQAVK